MVVPPASKAAQAAGRLTVIARPMNVAGRSRGQAHVAANYGTIMKNPPMPDAARA